jgi:hypothetical protein
MPGTVMTVTIRITTEGCTASDIIISTVYSNLDDLIRNLFYCPLLKIRYSDTYRD